MSALIVRLTPTSARGPAREAVLSDLDLAQEGLQRALGRVLAPADAPLRRSDLGEQGTEHAREMPWGDLEADLDLLAGLRLGGAS